MKTIHIQHLYWRAGFGINPNELSVLTGKSKTEIVKRLFRASSSFSPLKINTPEIDAAINKMKKPSKAKLRELIKNSNQKSLEFNVAWIKRQTNTDELLRERMTLFWANHFVCEDKNIVHIQQYNNTLRKNALGHFGDFVKEISREASMIKYLNNKQNIKAKPNENFARELLELFTLGNGNYSEIDIKEAARAFTGWNHTIKGEFVFRKFQHDFYNKEFLGTTGNFTGDEIINIILKEKQCARFICMKIYKYFVNENLDNSHIEAMTSIFYKDYSIEKLMRFVFASDWFYDSKNIGTKIKSPIELLVGINKVVPVAFANDIGLLRLQKILGQVLLRPPNVAGWKGGKTWIDSNTMMIRLKLPSVLLSNAIIALEEKGDLKDSYQMYYSRMNQIKKKLETTPDWSYFEKSYRNTSLQGLINNLILSNLNKGTEQLLNKLKFKSKKDFCIQLMSLPEYQLC
jgi:uncharacterized protein (DUF1800 family)